MEETNCDLLLLAIALLLFLFKGTDDSPMSLSFIFGYIKVMLSVFLVSHLRMELFFFSLLLNALKRQGTINRISRYLFPV